MPFYNNDLTTQDLLDYLDAHPQRRLILYSEHNIANAEILVRDGILKELIFPPETAPYHSGGRCYTYVEK